MTDVLLGEYAMHTAKLSVDARYAPIWEFTCHAPIGASCRLVCVEGCEEVDTQNHDHELKDCGECQYVLWLDNDDAMVECQKGGTFLAWEGPVKIEWENDHYEFTPLTAERDAFKAENESLETQVQRMVDRVCHYRFLAIKYGAKPEEMINVYDRKLAEQGLDPDAGESFDMTEAWDEVDSLKAENKALRATIERVHHALVDAREAVEYLAGQQAMTDNGYLPLIEKADAILNDETFLDAVLHLEDGKE